MQFISTNKHEYNIRRVDELSGRILMKEKELDNASGLLEVIKIKLQLRKLNKQINVHGSEVLHYEQTKFESDLK